MRPYTFMLDQYMNYQIYICIIYIILVCSCVSGVRMVDIETQLNSQLNEIKVNDKTFRTRSHVYEDNNHKIVRVRISYKDKGANLSLGNALSIWGKRAKEIFNKYNMTVNTLYGSDYAWYNEELREYELTLPYELNDIK
jgi:hypothetical protein